jgi:hypothetical protein
VRSNWIATPLYLFVDASDLPENRCALFGPMRERALRRGQFTFFRLRKP